jgi:hypothetical protein
MESWLRGVREKTLIRDQPNNEGKGSNYLIDYCAQPILHKLLSMINRINLFNYINDSCIKYCGGAIRIHSTESHKTLVLKIITSFLP